MHYCTVQWNIFGLGLSVRRTGLTPIRMGARAAVPGLA
jgi:hypothetical protein